MTLTALALLAALTGCSDTPSGPDLDPLLVAGAYAAEGQLGAVVFTTRSGEEEEKTDWLAQGASIVLTLEANGTTGGHLFIPGMAEDGGDIDDDLTGTWSIVNGRVELQHEADTFLRDMPFTWSDGRLVGQETWSVTVRVELVRR
jgi:hypothetical protein